MTKSSEKDSVVLGSNHWESSDTIKEIAASAGGHLSPLQHEHLQTDVPTAVCHGRVENLESRVPQQWWKTVFADAMYLKTDGDVVEDPEITKDEVALLEADPHIREILQKGSGGSKDQPAKVLDLCCGQGRHIIHLARQYPNLRLYGHDQSSYLISLGEERTAQQNLAAQTSFTVGDCRKIPYPDSSFDLVLVMGNSFGYFSDDDGDRIVLKEINRVLVPGGRVVLDLTDGRYMRENFMPRSWEWIDDTCFVCRERQLSNDGLRLHSREVVTVTTQGVVRDQFYQERLYSRSEMKELVEQCGFIVLADEQAEEDAAVITSAKELSKRKEDLGMMEQRLLVKAQKMTVTETSPSRTLGLPEHPLDRRTGALTAQAAKRVTITQHTPAPPPFENLVVIFGDTSKPCVGKFNNTWNQEDFATPQHQTVSTSPSAQLGRLTRLSVLDCHKTLHHTLATAYPAPSFVFNLCDEGFDNEATQELHVPAILDMLKIPYTGAGPNCLAYCYDKGLVSRTAQALGVPTPKETYFFAESSAKRQSIKEEGENDVDRLHSIITEEIGYPAFIKPLRGDNSLGITATRAIVTDKENLATSLHAIVHDHGINDVIVQEYLSGTEYTIGMVGNTGTGFHFFPVLEVDYTKIIEKQLPPILGFESKWDPNSPYWTDISFREAKGLPVEVVEDIKRWCILLWERFGCRDYARFDFRADIPNPDDADGKGKWGQRVPQVRLLEINPNPGWCWDGKLAHMAKLEGIEYKDLIRMVLQAAWDRSSHGSESNPTKP
ncbi:hypothetical protein BJ742DRAFT_685858 [Cladochytrium replicatum]|nr:hypothetical protein BJ742DRAFT_685858 [Cladochytrium replicatum]